MIERRLSSVKRNLPLKKENDSSFLLLAFSFLAGCLAGSLIGAFHGFDSALSDFIGFDALKSSDFFYIFLSFIRFHIAAFLLGSSFYGVVLLPVLSCLRGYALSCTAAAVISCYPNNGIIMAFVILGIPAVLSLPCFFLISTDGFLSSRRILNLVRGNSVPIVSYFYLRTLACLPVLAAGTAIEIKLVPYLVSLFI